MEPLNPAPFLNSLVGRKISVRLKWGFDYQGVLVSADAFMNLQLRDAEEINGNERTPMDEVLLRCNNVLYIRELLN